MKNERVEDLPIKYGEKNAKADEIISLVDTMRLDLAASRKVALDLLEERDRLLKLIDDLYKDFNRIFKGDKE
jgi:hypothetical protein